VLGQELIRSKAMKVLDLTALSDGMYYISLSDTKDQVKTVKVIIRH
jgi:hypothetical protein